MCELLGVTTKTIQIGDAVTQHFADIGHDPQNHNVVFENAQARERTQVLMDIANAENGLVVGTGDLSELALGWATYNGDHMSMYGVNAAVPKTLVRYLVAHEADMAADPALAAVLRDILATPVSPELLPASDAGDIAQKTEELVGPYLLHDFYLFYCIRRGYSPRKVLRLAETVFAWPGVGRLVVDAIDQRDIPTVTGALVMTTMLVTVVNLLIDIVYAFVDPRIKAKYTK